MNYFNYLFSDKKANKYWIFHYSALTIMIIMVLIFNERNVEPEATSLAEKIFPILVGFFVIFIFPLYYTYSFFNLMIQKTFVKNNPNLKFRELTVELCQSRYQTSTLSRNFYVNIKPEPTVDNFTIGIDNDTIAILGKTYDFGIFRQHLKPMVIGRKENVKMKKKKWICYPKNFKLNETENILEIEFAKSSNGISKLTIKDWKE